MHIQALTHANKVNPDQKALKKLSNQGKLNLSMRTPKNKHLPGGGPGSCELGRG